MANPQHPIHNTLIVQIKEIAWSDPKTYLFFGFYAAYPAPNIRIRTTTRTRPAIKKTKNHSQSAPE